MNKEILIAMAEKWEREAQAPECEDGSDSAKYSNAVAEGARKAKLECAKKLRELIALLG
jgi:hypothetical protein